jgi:hypothetical protein
LFKDAALVTRTSLDGFSTHELATLQDHLMRLVGPD